MRVAVLKSLKHLGRDAPRDAVTLLTEQLQCFETLCGFDFCHHCLLNGERANLDPKQQLRAPQLSPLPGRAPLRACHASRKSRAYRRG